MTAACPGRFASEPPPDIREGHMPPSDLPRSELDRLVPAIVDAVSRQVVEALKRSAILRGGYDCTGAEFDCLNKYTCRNSDSCENIFDCPNLYEEAR
jgi:hypothetical protein